MQSALPVLTSIPAGNDSLSPHTRFSVTFKDTARDVKAAFALIGSLIRRSEIEGNAINDLLEEAGKESEVLTNPLSWDQARIFLEVLPPYIPLPDVDVDRSGNFHFEWRQGNKAILTLTCLGDGRVAWAGSYKIRRLCGYEDFKYEIDPDFIRTICRVFE